jgi:hypothetical protein
MDSGRGLVVDRDHEDKAHYAFTGTVKEVVFDRKPVHQEPEKALHEHASVQTSDKARQVSPGCPAGQRDRSGSLHSFGP